MPISNILKKFFGSKSQRDVKEIIPFLNKIRTAYTDIELLSNDALRAKTIEINEFVRNTIRENEDKISNLKQQVESGNLDVEKVEDIYLEIDRIEKEKQKLEEQYQESGSQEIYARRKTRSEHPFGHIKRNLKTDSFLLRGREGVQAETSLLGTCFNVARMITIFGVSTLIERLVS